MRLQLGLSAEPLDSIPDQRLSGVGMIRAEYLCRNIEQYVTLDSCRRSIAGYLGNVCRLFGHSDVWYRTTDLVVPEVNVLEGADHVFEEKHYTHGLRGVRRGLLYPDTFRVELQNLAAVREHHSNLHILLPYVYDCSELATCIELLRGVGFDGKIGMMAEIPSAILRLPEFLDLGVQNVTIGVNDLTSLTLGTYRGTPYHDPCHSAVLGLIEQTVYLAHARDVPVSVGGYVTPELMEACGTRNVDNFIVHYSDLPRVLCVDEESLPHRGMLNEIKKRTKARIAARAETPRSGGEPR